MAEKKGKLQNLKNSIFPYSKFGDTSMVFVQAICETEANQAFAHVILYWLTRFPLENSSHAIIRIVTHSFNLNITWYFQ